MSFKKVKSTKKRTAFFLNIIFIQSGYISYLDISRQIIIDPFSNRTHMGDLPGSLPICNRMLLVSLTDSLLNTTPFAFPVYHLRRKQEQGLSFIRIACHSLAHSQPFLIQSLHPVTSTSCQYNLRGNGARRPWRQ